MQLWCIWLQFDQFLIKCMPIVCLHSPELLQLLQVNLCSDKHVQITLLIENVQQQLCIISVEVLSIIHYSQEMYGEILGRTHPACQIETLFIISISAFEELHGPTCTICAMHTCVHVCMCIQADIPCSGKVSQGKVWQIDSFQAFGERKFGELIYQPIGY